MISYARRRQQDDILRRLIYLALLLVFASGGLPAEETVTETLIGTPITEPAWSAEIRARLEKDLEIARAVMEVAPEREDSYIWLGRRLGYLTRYGEAIDVFTKALERFPDSYKLLRFRGRHLARNREFDRAVADYKRAAELVENIQDSYEPDGIINPRHQYLGSYRSNIHYYLGQTSWALGDYQATLDGMTRAASEPLVQHDDRRVATGFWQYLALRKLGRHEEARSIVDAIPEGLELVENHDYYDGIRYFKGTLTEEELLPRARTQCQVRCGDVAPDRRAAEQGQHGADGPCRRVCTGLLAGRNGTVDARQLKWRAERWSYRREGLASAVMSRTGHFSSCRRQLACIAGPTKRFGAKPGAWRKQNPDDWRPAAIPDQILPRSASDDTRQASPNDLSDHCYDHEQLKCRRVEPAGQQSENGHRYLRCSNPRPKGIENKRLHEKCE